MSIELEPRASADELRSPTAIIDCDVHLANARGLAGLGEYMSSTWRHRLGWIESDGPSWKSGYAGMQVVMPTNNLFMNVAGAVRGDAMHGTAPPASDPDFVERQLLDDCGITRAIILGQDTQSLGVFADPEVASTIASAWNEWVQEVWLQRNPRWRSCITIAPQDPAAAAREIDRVADRPGFVAVQVPLYDIAMGERHFYPIYEAAQRHGLPIAIHVSGTEGVYARAPHTAFPPTYYLEWHAVFTQPVHHNAISMLCHGVFERFPELKLVVTEGGWLWAIDAMLKLDRDWLSLKDEVPWMKQAPSEYLRKHLRFTTQPFPEPHRREHLAHLLEMVYAEQTLMYSSDYPHFDFDDPQRALSGVQEPLRRRIYSENAIEFYGDRLR